MITDYTVLIYYYLQIVYEIEILPKNRYSNPIVYDFEIVLVIWYYFNIELATVRYCAIFIKI